jgi:hypothetical protein
VLGATLATRTTAALTTFEEYSAMDREKRNEVRSNAIWLLYKDAVEREDTKLALCMRRKYVDGPKDVTHRAHARILGLLDAGIEIHEADSRVEYAIANHILAECSARDPALR